MKRASMMFHRHDRMDRAGFVGIVAANIFIAVLLRNTLNYANPGLVRYGRMLLAFLIFWASPPPLCATHHRRPDWPCRPKYSA